MLQIQIGDVNLYEDYELICINKKISPAQLKTKYIEIPFRDGSLDISELHGKKYKDRTIDMVLYKHMTSSSLPAMESGLNNLFDELGKTSIIFSDDSDWQWHGRVSLVSASLKGMNYCEFVLKAVVEPYKWNLDEVSL